MTDDTGIRVRLEVLEEIFRELIRRDVLTDDMITSVAERFGVEAQNHRGSSRAEHYELAAHQVTMLPFEAEQPVVRQSDVHAEFRRKQMRERTARLSTDGGKNDG